MQKNYIYNEFLDALERAVEYCGSAIELARVTGFSASNISRWRSCKQQPRLSELSTILELVGAHVSVSGDPSSKPVTFSKPSLVQTEKDVPEPSADNFIAIPVIADMQKITGGFIPKSNIKDWVCVGKDFKSIRSRKNLVVIEYSGLNMSPLLTEGDLVLVDRDDREVTEKGRIMLARTPAGEILICRVAAEETEQDIRITLYGDNIIEVPPRIYSFVRDYSANWDNVVLGRLIWSRSDISSK